MDPDAILDYYNHTQVNGEVFADYVNPRTGVRQIKVQHPEFETYMGAGSVHKDTFTCADCHMGEATAADGTTYISHTWISPLENKTLLDNTCAQCHTDLAGQVADIQEEAERRTWLITAARRPWALMMRTFCQDRPRRDAKYDRAEMPGRTVISVPGRASFAAFRRPAAPLKKPLSPEKAAAAVVRPGCASR